MLYQVRPSRASLSYATRRMICPVSIAPVRWLKDMQQVVFALRTRPRRFAPALHALEKPGGVCRETVA